MKSILNFESNVYSEELFAGISEADYNEVIQASAGDYDGYSEWSEELEQGERVNTQHGPILINKECTHRDCHTTRCSKGATYGGIAI